MNEGADITVSTVGSPSVAILPDHGPLLSSEADAVDIIGSLYGSDADWIAIPVARLAPDFFDLANRKAGLFFQKLVNYRLGAVIVGDISPWTAHSKPLRDFVTETRSGGQVRFADDVDALNALLGA